jgi:hypothetical protein
MDAQHLARESSLFDIILYIHEHRGGGGAPRLPTIVLRTIFVKNWGEMAKTGGKIAKSCSFSIFLVKF